jgi:hypothetical protein
MPRGLRRVSALIVAALLLVTNVAPALAAPAAKISLEEAVVIAKTAFTIPSAFSEFSSSFSSYSGKPRWQLNWESAPESETQGSMSVTIDAETKDILSMYIWQYDPNPKPALPKHSRAEAEKVAREFAARIQPRFAETRLAEESYAEPYGGRSVEEYSFFFERIVNGLPFAANGIRVQVDANDLSIRSYSYTWDSDLIFPDPAHIVGESQGREAFLSKGAPRLIYYRPRPDGDKERPVLLVYNTEQSYRYGVDALTGKVIRLDQWYRRAKEASGDLGAAAPMDEGRVELTPEEEAEVREILDLLSQEEALAAATKVVRVPKGYTLASANLRKNWDYPSLRLWDFYWSLETGQEEQKSGSISVSVDARSGEILSFSRYEWDPEKDSKKPEVNYSEDEAREIAIRFIESLQPERFAACKEEEPVDRDIIPLYELDHQDPPRSYSFTWARYVNDIPFPQHGFRVEVNSTTGEVTSYNMNWADLSLPVPEDLLSQEEANATLLAESPLVLEYLTVPEPQLKLDPENEKPPVRLVYHLRTEGTTRMFDAKTGVFLDWQGNPVPDKKAASFSDIAGHWAEADIQLLAERRVVTGAPDGLFHPDENITQPAYMVMLLRTLGYQPREQTTDGPWYSLYEKEARRRGILKEGETLGAVAPTTREQAAVWTIRALGQDRIASLEGIWQVPAADASAVKYLGHVALYIAQGLDPAPANSFEPALPLTRAKAASGMVKVLSLPRP